MFTAIGDILDNLDLFAGSQISVSGQLLVGEDDRPFLATDYQAYKRGERLPVVDSKQIVTHLLGALPVYGGGDVIYDERAYLTGTVVKQPGGYVLADLRACKVVRDAFEIMIPLDAGRDAATT